MDIVEKAQQLAQQQYDKWSESWPEEADMILALCEELTRVRSLYRNSALQAGCSDRMIAKMLYPRENDE